MARFKARIPTFAEIIRHLFLGWLIASFIEYMLVPAGAKGLDTIGAIATMSFPRLLTVTFLCAAGLWAASCCYAITKYERYAIPAVFALQATAGFATNDRPAFLIILLIALLAMIVYSIRGHRRMDTAPVLKSHWAFPTVLTVLTLGMAAFLCAWSVLRYVIFSTPCYDFGIFSQMFHSMKTTGLPMTTVERDGLLSHFAVHVSPIYYLMLPLYALFPDPVTLQIQQVAILCSAVIPLWLIGKHHGLSGLSRLLVCILMLVLPAVGGGVHYDLHENCFLLPLILWLMYAMDKRNTALTGVFAFLILMVKEDAAVYVAIAAMYLLLRTALNYRREYRKELITGAAMLLGASIYFLLVTNYLATHGDGVMTGRYYNFMLHGSDSIFTVVIAVLLCPLKMLYECVDPEKHAYILQTLLPLLGLPLLTRKYERYLLLIPYLLLNLMSDYEFQHNVLFQYNFGSTAFLLYLTAVNLSDLKIKWARIIPGAAAIAVSLAFFSDTVFPKAKEIIGQYRKFETYFDGVRDNLDLIPENVTVASCTFYVAYLSERPLLYDIRYATEEHILSVEYIVVNKKITGDFKNWNGSFENFVAMIENAGYQLINNHSSVFIYHKALN